MCLSFTGEGRANIVTIPLIIRIHVRVVRVAIPRVSSTILTRSPKKIALTNSLFLLMSLTISFN